MSVLRSVLAAVLLSGALALGAFSLAANWAQQNLLDSDRWTATVAPLIDRSDVQERVTAALVDSLVEAGLPSSARSLASATTARVVASSGFADAWTSAVRLSHQELVTGLRSDSGRLVIDDRAVAVDLGALVDAIKPGLSAMGVPFVASLPRPDGQVVLDSSPELIQALKVARVLDRWAEPSAIISVLLLLGSVLVAPRWAKAALVAGVLTAVVAAIGLAAWLILRPVLLDGVDPIAAAVARALTADVSTWLAAVAAGGAVASLAAGAQHFRHRSALR